MRAVLLGLVAVLILLSGFPLGFAATKSSSATPTVKFSPASGPIGTTVQVTGTGLQNETQVAVLFGGVVVVPMVTPSNGSVSADFIVPLVNSSGDYSISLAWSNGSKSSPTEFNVTYGLNNLVTEIHSIQLNSNQTAQLAALELQMNQIMSAESAQSSQIQSIDLALSSQENSNSSALRAQQNLTIYLAIATIAALAVAGFSSYSLYKLKKKKFDELEVIQ
jgi:hypothetical protein